MATESASAEYVEARIQEVLAHDRRVVELHVEASVRGDEVFLSGEVPTEERRAAVAQIVAELEPDLRVHNQIRVSEITAPPATAEELE